MTADEAREHALESLDDARIAANIATAFRPAEALEAAAYLAARAQVYATLALSLEAVEERERLLDPNAPQAGAEEARGRVDALLDCLRGAGPDAPAGEAD